MTVIGPTIDPAFLAYRCSSSRMALSVTSTSSMIVSHSLLIVEGLFLGAFDRVLEHVVQTAEARGLALVDQLLAAAGDQQRLHVGLGLRQVEQLPPILGRAHLQDSLGLVELHVRQRTSRHVHVRVALLRADSITVVPKPRICEMVCLSRSLSVTFEPLVDCAADRFVRFAIFEIYLQSRRDTESVPLCVSALSG